MATFDEIVLPSSMLDDRRPLPPRKTRIVCTIGPSCWEVPKLCEMMKAGMNIARLNFSHGDHPTHARSVERVREASRITGIPCAILLDTKGPEIRTGLLKDGKPVKLEAGQSIDIWCGAPDDFRGDSTMFSIDYANAAKVMAPGRMIKIADGLIRFRVEKIRDQILTCTVLNTATLGERKGTNLPGTKVDLPPVTDRDVQDLKFAVEHKLDFIAASFARSGEDMKHIKDLTRAPGLNLQIIAKIENHQGMDDFDNILRESDGIMVARGDLGVEIPIEQVCVAQKRMIRKCNVAGKPVITATQMLESMIENPRPTRAEAGDVANAVFDGTDCVMLSGESANGAFPIEAVTVMARICQVAETSLDYESFFQSILHHTRKPLSRAEAITSSAVKTARDLEVPLMVVLTETGGTARFVAKYKPCQIVIVCCHDEQVARQCLVSRALWPLVVAPELSDEQATQRAVDFAKERRWASPHDEYVVVSGLVYGKSGGTNTLRVLEVL